MSESGWEVITEETLHNKQERDASRIQELEAKLTAAEKVNRIAAGCISVAYPHFHSKHPQDVLDWLKRQAIDAAKGE